MSKITDILDAIPPLGGEFLKRQEFVDPTTGIVIHQFGDTAFRSSIVLQTSIGPVPVEFALPGPTLNDAIVGWPSAARTAVREFLVQLENSHRRIVLPGGAADQPPFQRRPA